MTVGDGIHQVPKWTLSTTLEFDVTPQVIRIPSRRVSLTNQPCTVGLQASGRF